MSDLHYYQGAEQERSRIIAIIDDMLQQLTPRHAPSINPEFCRGNIGALKYLRSQLIGDDLDDLRAGIEIARQRSERDEK